MVRLAFAFLLSLCVSAQAQLSGGVGGFPGPGTAHSSGGCSEATTFLARTSGLDATHTTAYTDMICGLVTDGLWTKLDLLYIFATQDSTTANLNLKSTSFTAVPTGSPTFTADRGYTTSTSVIYVASSFVPSTDGVAFTQNSAHISAWNLAAGAGSTDRIFGNEGTATVRTTLRPFNASSQTGFSVNNNTESLIANGTGKVAQFIANRSGASANEAYINGSSIGSAAQASTGVANAALRFGGDGVGGNGCACQIAQTSLGGSLNSTEAGNFYTRIRTYLTAVGAP